MDLINGMVARCFVNFLAKHAVSENVSMTECLDELDAFEPAYQCVQ